MVILSVQKIISAHKIAQTDYRTFTTRQTVCVFFPLLFKPKVAMTWGQVWFRWTIDACKPFCDSRWRGSWKALSVHPRVCRDCFQLPQSHLQKHIPSLCSWIENHSLCVLSWEPLWWAQRSSCCCQSLTLCAEFCWGLGQEKERSKCCHGKTIPRPVPADYFDTQLTDVSKHSFYWCVLEQEWFKQPIPVLRRCHKLPTSSCTVLEGSLVRVSPEVTHRGDTGSH